jgi:hypothetical protein
MERLEGSPRGRVALSVAIAAFLALLVVANLPGSHLRREVMRVGDPVLSATGARQVWSVFAPDPPMAVTETEVRFHYADGTSGTWKIEKRNPFVGSYRDYRWLKLGENVQNANAGPGLLAWAIAQRAAPKPLAGAELVRRFRPIARPGRPESDHPPFREQVLFQAGPQAAPK